MNHDEECDHDGPHGEMYSTELPVWKFSLWDVAGITVFTAAGILDRLANGFGLLARECQAAANRSRQEYDLQAAQEARERQQAEDAQALRALVEGPEATS